MRSIITVPFRLVAGIAGTLLQVIGLVLNFGFKGARFAGGRFFTILLAGIVGFFLGKKYFAGKDGEAK
jgi:hypothetical protein